MQARTLCVRTFAVARQLVNSMSINKRVFEVRTYVVLQLVAIYVREVHADVEVPLAMSIRTYVDPYNARHIWGNWS